MSPWIARSSFALLAAALVAGLLYGTLSAQETQGPAPATLSVSPASQSVATNAQAKVNVNIAGVTDPDGLGSYEFIMAFNHQVLEFDSFADGAFLGSTGRDVDCLPVLLDVDQDGDVDPGFVRVGCVTFALEPAGPMGGGQLASLTFNALCGGESPITFDLINLSDPEANDIPSANVVGGVTVTGTPCGGGPSELGDVDCDGNLTAIDAALVLQLESSIINALPCAQNADLNGDGNTNSIDALFILQIVAGLLPPP